MIPDHRRPFARRGFDRSRLFCRGTLVARMRDGRWVALWQASTPGTELLLLAAAGHDRRQWDDGRCADDRGAVRALAMPARQRTGLRQLLFILDERELARVCGRPTRESLCERTVRERQCGSPHEVGRERDILRAHVLR